MTALDDAAAFAIDPVARPAITAAIESAAVQIAAEDPETDNHYQRAMLAFQVLNDPVYLAERFAWAISTNATVVGKWTTNDFDGAKGDFGFVISSVWNALAGPPPVTPSGGGEGGGGGGP